MTNGVRVETGIPIPARGTTRKYGLAELQVTESLFVPAPESELRTVQLRLAACMKWQRRYTGKVFTQRIVRGEKTGVRVWRIE